MSAAALSVKPLRGPSLRAAVFQRDGGVCALCGFDTEALRVRLVGLRVQLCGSAEGTTRYRSMLRALKVPAHPPYWEADHTIPVVEGGPSTLTNLRTLCWECHAKATAELRQRMRRRPSRARALRRKRQRAGRSA